MAEVYVAEHVALRKRVALKVLSEECASNPVLRQRFLREGERAVRIRHPNVVDITDVGMVGDTPYLVMELLEGETLGDRLEREGRMPIEEAVPPRAENQIPTTHPCCGHSPRMTTRLIAVGALIGLSCATACGDASETATSSTGAGGQGAEHGTTTSGQGGNAAGGHGTGGTGGASLHVATDGDDAASGTEAEPFATLQRAVDIATAGDTIVVRGGVYALTTSVVIDSAGTADAPIRIVAYDGETPIFDASDNPRHDNPPEPRIDDSIAATSDALGLFVTGNAEHWHIAGLEIAYAPYYGVRVYGSHNVFERLVLHDHGASGLEITGKEGFSPSHNLVLNSDSFHNFDPQGNGEDADGFAAKFDSLGPGNVFRGLRAWSNADDGYDFWHAAPLLIEDCWSFDNGFNRPEWVPLLTGGWQGDGMGFKLGQEAGELSLVRVAAWGNKAFGIDDNGNGSAGGVTIHHATLVNNTKDGNPVQLDLNDGSPHTVRNTIAFDVDGPAVTSLDGAVDHASNSWNGMTVTAADFVDLDMDALFLTATGPRNSDGTLPPIGLSLQPGSALIDAGVDLGLPFEGAAPDLGAFELSP